MTKKQPPKFYIAVEYANDEFTDINDHGTVVTTPEEAWRVVSEVFEPKYTLICEVVPVSKVLFTTPKFISLKKD